MDGITQLMPDGYRITLTGRIVTIHGMDRTMRGKVICRVISTCNQSQAQEDVDLGFLLPVPLKGTCWQQWVVVKYKLCFQKFAGNA